MMTDISRLKYIGREVIIGEYVKIVNPEVVEINDHSRIDDFTLIMGGEGIYIGKYVHISSFCSVVGGEKLWMYDFSGLSAGCRLITGTDDYSGKSMTNPCVPREYLNPTQGHITIHKHAIIGTNGIILSNVEIGEGAAIGAGSLVWHNVKEWTINMGNPLKTISQRERNTILEMEASLGEKYE